jgi:hypothetical protein
MSSIIILLNLTAKLIININYAMTSSRDVCGKIIFHPEIKELSIPDTGL